MNDANEPIVIRTQKKIQVDFDTLFKALESRDSDCFLNLKTGDVISLPHDEEFLQEERARLKADRRSFKKLDPFPSNIAFGVIEDFVKKLDKKPHLKKALTNAIKESKPFRRFKDVISEDREARDEWFAFQRMEMEYWVPWWLRKTSIDVDVVIKNPTRKSAIANSDSAIADNAHER